MERYNFGFVTTRREDRLAREGMYDATLPDGMSWDRWHELLTIQGKRELDALEQVEYAGYDVIVKGMDSEALRVQREALAPAIRAHEALLGNLTEAIKGFEKIVKREEKK